MAPRRVKAVNKLDYKKLSANDVICPICRSILIKPITLPCTHGFCSSCFETTTQNANVCPLCRVRVGSWLRSATKSNKLINEAFWRTIQDLFPLQVKNKLKGLNENFLGDYVKESEDLSKKIGSKVGKEIPVASTAGSVAKVTGPVTTVSKMLAANVEKQDSRSSFFLNNFATKEYTCRILCQNVSSKEIQKPSESQNLILKKNKRIQKIAESDLAHSRSNSIESECLYFKPIDYRHNPPSEGLTPIKVPTRKPNVSANVKILAPCGQNQININSLESAFARLCSPVMEEKVESCKKENVESQKSSLQGNSSVSLKRKHEKSSDQARKKVKRGQKVTEMIESNSDETSVQSRISEEPVSNNNIKKRAARLISEENLKRSLQEKADFELATKLQQTYNQSSKYSTRSSVLKTMACQVKMGEIMTPYKVK